VPDNSKSFVRHSEPLLHINEDVDVLDNEGVRSMRLPPVAANSVVAPILSALFWLVLRTFRQPNLNLTSIESESMTRTSQTDRDVET